MENEGKSQLTNVFNKWVIPASKGEFGRMKIRFIFTFIFSAFLMVINHRIIRHYYVLKSQPFTVFKEWFTSCSTWPLCFDYKTHKTQQKRIFSSSWTLVPSSSFAKTSLPVTTTTTVVSSHTWEGCTLASFASTAAKTPRAFAISQLENYSSRSLKVRNAGV